MIKLLAPAMLCWGSLLALATIAMADVAANAQRLTLDRSFLVAQGDGEAGDKEKNPVPQPVQASPENPESAEETLDEDEPAIADEDGSEPSTPNNGYTPPVIQRDLTNLPFPARRMHELLMEAAKSGEIDRLRPYLGVGPEATMLTFGGLEGDPIEFLKSMSGDSDGYEILAILQEVLESGYVHLDAGTDNEIYVWPYFFAYPLAELTPAQRVEMYRLMTHGDYQEMQTFGAYIFFRVGISPAGRWRFFVAGD